MTVHVKTGDQIYGAWPRAKTTDGWRTPTRVFVKVDGVWREVLRNSIKVQLGDPDGAQTIIHNFNLRAYLESIGRWTGNRMRVDVTVLPNTYIVAPFLGITEPRNPDAAFTTGNGWPVGSVVTLRNYGFILGAAGLPGRPRLIVKADDPQNVEQPFGVESRITQKLNFRTILHILGQQRKTNNPASGAENRDGVFLKRADISTGILSSTGVDIGAPTDGGDAIENTTTMILYNYGKVYGGGGGGGSWPHICLAGYWMSRNINTGAAETMRGYGETTPHMGGFGAGDLRFVDGVTATGFLSRTQRTTPTEFYAALANTANYGTVKNGVLLSDRWGENGRLGVNGIYMPDGGTASPNAKGQGQGRNLSYYVQVNMQGATAAVGPARIQNPTGFDLAKSHTGVYALPDNTYAAPNAVPEVATINKQDPDVGLYRFTISGGHGGNWGQDGRPCWWSAAEHDMEMEHYSQDPKTGETIVYPPEHYAQKKRGYIDNTYAMMWQGAPAPSYVGTDGVSYGIYDGPSYEAEALQYYPSGVDAAYYGYSALRQVLENMSALAWAVQPSDVSVMNSYQTMVTNTYTSGAYDEVFTGDIKTPGSALNKLMKPGRGGRAVKGAASVLFMTPQTEGFLGRIE